MLYITSSNTDMFWLTRMQCNTTVTTSKKLLRQHGNTAWAWQWKPALNASLQSTPMKCLQQNTSQQCPTITIVDIRLISNRKTWTFSQNKQIDWNVFKMNAGVLERAATPVCYSLQVVVIESAVWAAIARADQGRRLTLRVRYSKIKRGQKPNFLNRLKFDQI